MIMPRNDRLNSSLLSIPTKQKLSMFNHEFKNFGVKMGAIIETYNIKNEYNISKFMPEYDVLVIEQNENLGTTSTIYRNCISMDSLGSVADFFRVKYRNPTDPNIKINLDPTKHDGSFVLLMCIDGVAEKGIIIGGLPHPNKEPILTEEAGHHMEGEFNGLNFQVNKDGELTVTFKSASNNDGSYVNEEAGGTFVKIEKDGSLEINNNKTEKVRIDKTNSTISVEADKDIEFKTGANYKIEAKEDLNAKVKGLLADASGSATFNIGQNFEVKAKGQVTLRGNMLNINADSLINAKAKTIIIDGSSVILGGGGMPAVVMGTKFIGTGNNGAPVVSNAMGPFSGKVLISS